MNSSHTIASPVAPYIKYVLGVRATAVLLAGLGLPALVYACYWIWRWVTGSALFDARTTGPAGLLYQVFASREFWDAAWSWIESRGGAAIAGTLIGGVLFWKSRKNRRVVLEIDVKGIGSEMMGDFAWIKLLLRAIGVLLIGLGVPVTLSSGANLANLYLTSSGAPPSYLTTYFVTFLGYAVQAGFGFYLLLGGRLIVRLCLSDLEHACLRCGYDISAVSGPVCPECGSPFVHRTADRSPASAADELKP